MVELDPGMIVGLFFGVMYMFGFVYYIYKKFLLIIFEDLICLLDGKENEETNRPIVYSILHSLSFLILCFFSTFSSQSSLGIAAIIGSDSFNTFFILALVFVKFKEANHGYLDTWITFRDAIIYILGLVTMLLCLVFQWVNLWSAIVLVAFYIINYWVLSSNQDIKEKLMEWLGLKNEDNEFNSDEHFQCRKRRLSLTTLKERECLDYSDPNFLKKLNRMEALLVIQFKTNDQKHAEKRVYMRWQKAGYQIIFAIKNYVKQEKLDRIEKYVNMYKPKQKRGDSPRQLQDSFNQQIKDEKKDAPSAQKNEPEGDDDPLINGKDSSLEKNGNQAEEKPESSNKVDELPDQKSIHQAHNESYNDGGINLKMPKPLGQKILFIIFFPVHLILYLLPNYLENPIPKKLVLCFFLNILLLCGCMFLIDWWLQLISIGTGIPLDVLGVVLAGVSLSIHFLEYNYKVAKDEKQLEFVQSFFQLGICKISMCSAIPWLFRVIVKLDITVVIKSAFGFAIAIAIFGAIILVFLIIAILSRFRIGAEDGVKMGVLYIIFIVASTVVIITNQKPLI